MQRRPPSRQPRAAASAGASSSREPASSRRIKNSDDIPEEFREMLVESIKESRATASSVPTETPPKRKKPLTRDRRPPEPKTEEKSRPEPLAVPSADPGPSLSNKRKRDEPVTPTKSKPTQATQSPAVEDDIPDWLKQVAEEYTSELAKPSSSPLNMKSKKPTQEDSSDEEEESDDDDDFDDEEDDDADWETVDLSKISPKLVRNDEPIVFEISSSKAPAKAKKSGRMGPTPAERKIRLEVHKMHLLCLLAHVHLRSTYCNDGEVQDALLPILEKRVIAELNDSSFQQTKIFKQGLSNAAAAFKRKFKVTRPGMRKALWGNIPTSPSALYGDLPMALEEFRDAAKKLTGTRDLAAQLFCAMLRRTGLEVRLVSSLQPLSYLFKAKYSIDDSKRRDMKLIEEDENDYRTSEDDSEPGFVGNVNKAYGGPGPINFRAAPIAPIRTGMAAGRASGYSRKKDKQIRVHDPALPIYWVEVFDVINQSWIAVDPLGLGVVRRFDTFEPPHSDAWENEMAYVVAFDNDNKVRDITRKYVKSFNSYTRTLRVEATLDGGKWWRKALKPFTIPSYMVPDRDQFENGLMDDKLLREGVPKSLAAMKSHPVFAIEEQLRQDEVIYPKNECGKMVGKNKKTIPVYRRQDVKRVKTATQWYMLGREIKAGEQPLKRKKVRRRRAMNLEDLDPDELAELEVEDTGMYAQFQTIIYRPDPCMGPIVPKNAYGNIDLYVPSMLPSGGVHIPHKLARAAANALGIGDYVADAVTGFDFKAGGRSTPVIKGIVAAEENEEAIWAMIEHIEQEQRDEADEKRRIVSLNMWRKFLIGLRIKERVDGYALDDEENEPKKPKESAKGTDSESADDETVESEDGGFVRDESASLTLDEPADNAGGFFTDDLEEFAGKAMRLEVEQREARELAVEIEQARSRRARLADIERQKMDEELYDPDAIESGGGFFTEDISPKASQDIAGNSLRSFLKGEKKQAADLADTGGGFFADEPSPKAPSDARKRKAEDALETGGGFFAEEPFPQPRPGKKSRTSSPLSDIKGKRKVTDFADLGGGGFFVDEVEQPRKKRSRTNTPDSTLLPARTNQAKRKHDGEDEAEERRGRKRTRSVTPPLVTERRMSKELEEELFGDTSDDEGNDDITALKLKEKEEKKEEARRLQDSLADKIAKGEEVEIPESLLDEEVHDEDFEYEDAGWASD
ncbi:hypothetical protein ABW19_dt0206412 [Dactylella cylindrospora]|nr:hypothetical protein ABW19_dt0206412 [Dactylella cylindrospora]